MCAILVTSCVANSKDKAKHSYRYIDGTSQQMIDENSHYQLFKYILIEQSMYSI